MTQIHIATVHPLPSSILHNSTEVRRQHTRAAARFVARKVGSWGRKAKAATPDIPQEMQGQH